MLRITFGRFDGERTSFPKMKREFKPAFVINQYNEEMAIKSVAVLLDCGMVEAKRVTTSIIEKKSTLLIGNEQQFGLRVEEIVD